MPAVFQKTVEQDLHKPLKIQYCADTVFTKDNTGNLINVLLFEDGVPYNGGGTVSATAIRADGATESWAGTISGNTVSVALTRAALDVPGTLQVFIKVTAGTVETTVYAGVYNVVCTETPTVVAPVTPSDVAALIASIEAAIRNIPADWTSFLGTIAPTFDPGKADGYAAGAYVWYPGQPDNVGTLYRFTSAHSGTWTGTDATHVVIGNELNTLSNGLSSLGYQVSVNTTGIDVIQRTIGSGLDPNNTVKSQLDGIKADIGTVPTGETVEGQIGDLKNALEPLYETHVERIDTSFDSSGLSDFWNSGYISISGTITDGHAGYRYSDLVDVNVGDSLNYANLRAIGANYALIAAYDSAGNYSRDNSVSGTGSFETGTYTVPSGIAKIRVSWYWSTNYVCALTLSESTPITDRLDTEIDELNAQMKTIVPRDFGDLEFTEQYVDNNGNIINRGTVTNRLSNKIYNLGRDIEYANIRGLVNRGYALAAFGFDDAVIPSKSIITDGTSGSGSYFTASGTFSFTDDVAYIRLSYYLYDQPTMSASWFEEINSFEYIESLIGDGGIQWSGKKWVAFGTSITDTNNTLAPDGTATGKFVPYLKALSGMTVTNYGIAGASIGYNEGYVSGAILTKIKSADSLAAIQAADLITIEGFVNDFVGNVPIGAIGDTTNATLIGGIYDAVTYISTQNANATIILLTDTTGRYTDSGNLPVTRQNALGKYQHEYLDAIISIAKYLGVHVINCGQTSQINQWHTQYLIDHIHQTELGGAQYAATIWDELKNIHCNADVTTT